MRLKLAPYAFAASCAEDLVILDGQSGSYLCVPDAQIAPIACGDDVIVTDDKDLALGLAELRLLSEPRSHGFRRRPAPPLSRDRSSDLGAGFSRAEEWRGLFQALAASRKAYWRRPFADLLAAAAAASAARQGLDLAAAERTADLFKTVLPWVPFQGDCLYRSLVLRTLLAQEAIAATLVIGVQTWPFEAHAWLQAADVVLDDSFDHVSGFTPLVAL